MPLALAGATSGSTTLQATDAVTATLTLPSSTGTLLSTANPQSGGVIQVVSANTATTVSTTSTTLADTTLTATITPKFSTSKILVVIDHCGCRVQPSGVANRGAIVLLRNSTQILSLDTLIGFTATTNNNAIGSVSCNYLDSPATTSATTYKTQFALDSGGGTFYVQNTGSTGNSTSTITLMEIAA